MLLFIYTVKVGSVMIRCLKHGPWVPPSGRVKEGFLTSLNKNFWNFVLVTLNTKYTTGFGVGAQCRKYSKSILFKLKMKALFNS